MVLHHRFRARHPERHTLDACRKTEEIQLLDSSRLLFLRGEVLPHDGKPPDISRPGDFYYVNSCYVSQVYVCLQPSSPSSLPSPCSPSLSHPPFPPSPPLPRSQIPCQGSSHLRTLACLTCCRGLPSGFAYFRKALPFDDVHRCRLGRSLQLAVRKPKLVPLPLGALAD